MILNKQVPRIKHLETNSKLCFLKFELNYIFCILHMLRVVMV